MSISKTIPINKPFLDEEEIRAAVRVLRSGILTSKSGSGPNVLSFEEAFSRYVGSKYAVALNSGTAALHSSLVAADISKDDEVIVPSFTFVATAEMVALTGARPVFVDIDPKTYCVDPAEVEAAISSKTKAIIPVHLYGLTADMDPILEVARDYGLTVIEDAAQAHGAEYKGEKAGSLGDMACFSFYGSKNMVTGEGGMVSTKIKEYADKIRLIRSHGEVSEYQSTMIGHNYRMPELEAAIGLVQLRKLPKILEIRNRNAEAISEGLSDIEELQLPFVPEGFRHAWYVFTVRLKNANAAERSKVIERIREDQVGTEVYYSKPIHLLPHYRKCFGSFKLPETEAAAGQVFSLPTHPSLSEKDLTRIMKAVRASLY